MAKRPDITLSGVTLTGPAVWNKLRSRMCNIQKTKQAKAKVKDSVVLLEGLL